jgi:hypothetical protein
MPYQPRNGQRIEEGGYCVSGRHLLGPEDIQVAGQYHRCRRCHAEATARYALRRASRQSAYTLPEPPPRPVLGEDLDVDHTAAFTRFGDLARR